MLALEVIGWAVLGLATLAGCALMVVNKQRLPRWIEIEAARDLKDRDGRIVWNGAVWCWAVYHHEIDAWLLLKPCGECKHYLVPAPTHYLEPMT